MTSQATTAPRATNQNGVQLGPSRKELLELEREVDLYLAFWVQARDDRCALSSNGERA
jgi:hypothetical protein